MHSQVDEVDTEELSDGYESLEISVDDFDYETTESSSDGDSLTTCQSKLNLIRPCMKGGQQLSSCTPKQKQLFCRQ